MRHPAPGPQRRGFDEHASLEQGLVLAILSFLCWWKTNRMIGKHEINLLACCFARVRVKEKNTLINCAFLKNKVKSIYQTYEPCGKIQRALNPNLVQRNQANIWVKNKAQNMQIATEQNLITSFLRQLL